MGEALLAFPGRTVGFLLDTLINIHKTYILSDGHTFHDMIDDIWAAGGGGITAGVLNIFLAS